MTDLKFFIGLLELVSSAEQELGFVALSEKDKQLLKIFWENKDTENVVNVTYEALVKSNKDVIFSKSQYYKSLKKLIDHKIIERSGSSRSHTFVFPS